MVKEITDAEETSQPNDFSEDPGTNHTHSPPPPKKNN